MTIHLLVTLSSVDDLEQSLKVISATGKLFWVTISNNTKLITTIDSHAEATDSTVAVYSTRRWFNVILGYLWPPYGIGQAIMFLPCGFFYLFSSPILSRRRLDVYHTSTRGVALVRIYDASLKRAVRGSLKIQDAKNRRKFAICAPSHEFVGLYLPN